MRMWPCVQYHLTHAYRVMSHIFTGHVTFTYVTWRAKYHLTHMGWLRLGGSLQLYVSFAKEPYKRDDILQKRPIILRSLLIVATPYAYRVMSHIFTGHVAFTYVTWRVSFPRILSVGGCCMCVYVCVCVCVKEIQREVRGVCERDKESIGGCEGMWPWVQQPFNRHFCRFHWW